MRENGMMLALLAIVFFFLVVVRAVQDVDFLSAQNITNLFMQNSYVIIMALGMLLVIVSGHIDLSVGSVAAFTGAIAATLTVNSGWPVWAVMPAVLVAGAMIGAAQGYWIAFWRIPSFIVTLAGMLVFRGLTLWLLAGQNIGPFPREFQALSTGFVPDLFGVGRPNMTAIAVIVVAILAIIWQNLRARNHDTAFGMQTGSPAMFWMKHAFISAALLFVGWKLATFRGLPNVLIVMSILIVAYNFFANQTTTGRRINAEGGRRLRAGRYRGSLHRRRLHVRRFGQGNRCRGGCAHHGCHEQRHVDHGYRYRLPAGHQGPGAARRRHLRRLQQE
jgi:putative multiple sugar transport system permease protein